MGKNLAYQFTEMCVNNFKQHQGEDKHSDKATGIFDQHLKIYDADTLKNLLNLGNQLGKYVRGNNPEVRKIYNIKEEHIESFLESKVNNCTQQTINNYKSRICMLQRLTNDKYRCNVTWYNVDVPKSKVADKIRTKVFEFEDWNNIKNIILNKQELCKSDCAILLGGAFGLRVTSTTKIMLKDINLEKGTLLIYKDKGGRSRTLKIETKEQQQACKIILDKYKIQSGKILNINPDSVNKQLARYEKRLGIREKYKGAKTGIHSIRKMVSQDTYDKYRSTHTKEETIAYVNKILGHSAERSIENYVYYIW